MVAEWLNADQNENMGNTEFTWLPTIQAKLRQTRGPRSLRLAWAVSFQTDLGREATRGVTASQFGSSVALFGRPLTHG